MVSCGDSSQFASGNNTRNAEAVPEPKQEVFEDDIEEISDEFTVTVTEKANAPVDIVFLIDTSPSMDAELLYLKDSMQTFMDEYKKQNIKNEQLYIVSAPDFAMPSTIDPSTYARYMNRVWSNDALDVYHDLLSQGKFRPNVSREVIVVTDDNLIWQDSTDNIGEKAADFVAALAADFGAGEVKNTTINGILGLPGGKSRCEIYEEGTEYYELAGFKPNAAKNGLEPIKDRSTLLSRPGMLLDLCDKDWKKMVTQLATHIATKETNYTYTLSQPLVDAEKVVVKVDGVELPDTHYDIDFEKNQITFEKNMAPAPGKSFTVTYTTKVKKS